MRLPKWCCVLSVGLIGCASMSGDRTSAALKELAPTGKLRVAIGVSPAPSSFYAIKDATTGKFRGVTVDLGSALAQKLGVPVEFVPYPASGEVQAAANSGVWDVTFMPVDEERKKIMDFAAPIICCKAAISYRGAPRSSRLRTQTPPASVSSESRTRRRSALPTARRRTRLILQLQESTRQSKSCVPARPMRLHWAASRLVGQPRSCPARTSSTAGFSTRPLRSLCRRENLPRSLT